MNNWSFAYSAESERGFHVIVNSWCVSGAEDTDMGSSVHDDIGDRRIPAMPCSDSQPMRPVSVAGFVAGGAGGVNTQIARRPAALACRIGTAGSIRPILLKNSIRRFGQKFLSL